MTLSGAPQREGGSQASSSGGMGELLTAGGEAASRAEKMAVFRVKRLLEEDEAACGEWITGVDDSDVLRFVRARSR